VKWVEDKRAREIATSTESFSDRIRKLDQLMFPEDWEQQRAASQ
jgi:hypothetical protein